EVTRPYLPADHTTVGFEISVRHLAPAPLGSRITLTAELLAVDGAKLLFAVRAHSEQRRIGEGTLRRTIVRLGGLEVTYGAPCHASCADRDRAGRPRPRSSD